MTTPGHPEQSLEIQLEQLRLVSATDSAQRVLHGIKQSVRRQGRQVVSASFGACVSAIGAIQFTLQGDPFAYIALTLSTAVPIFVAWRSAGNASSLAALKSGASLLESWCAELRRDLHHTLIAQLLAVLFAALTAGVVWQHGIASLKSVSFLAMTAGICTFAAHQFLVLRPSLKKELQILEQDG